MYLISNDVVSFLSLAFMHGGVGLVSYAHKSGMDKSL